MTPVEPRSSIVASRALRRRSSASAEWRRRSSARTSPTFCAIACCNWRQSATPLESDMTSSSCVLGHGLPAIPAVFHPRVDMLTAARIAGDRISLGSCPAVVGMYYDAIHRPARALSGRNGGCRAADLNVDGHLSQSYAVMKAPPRPKRSGASSR